MTHPTFTELHEFLISQGFKCGNKYPLGEGTLYWWVLPTTKCPCLCNNGLQLNVVVSDLSFPGHTKPHRTVTVEIVGEYRENTWADIKLYNIPWERLLTELNTLREDAFRAWEALYGTKRLEP